MAAFANTGGIQNAVIQQPSSKVVNFNELARKCAPNIDPNTLQAVVRVESRFNPFAIGVVRGALPRQPTNLQEAIAAVNSLERRGFNYSMGLGQINKKNFKWLGLNNVTVFDPCTNLKAAERVLMDCFTRAENGRVTQSALQKTFSCYYSGNFRFGFTADFKGQPSYVNKILISSKSNSELAQLKIPAISSTVPISGGGATMKVNDNRPVKRTVIIKKAASVQPQSVENTQAVEAAVATEQPSPPKARQHWDAFGEF